jgi:hypothetical protein
LEPTPTEAEGGVRQALLRHFAIFCGEKFLLASRKLLFNSEIPSSSLLFRLSGSRMLLYKFFLSGFQTSKQKFLNYSSLSLGILNILKSIYACKESTDLI